MSEGNTDQANGGNEGPPKKSKADVKAAKNAQYADAWGIRKLISHCVRNLRIDRIPRVPRKHFWFYPFPKSSNSLERSRLQNSCFFSSPFQSETPSSRKLMKVFLDAWFPGSWAQLQLEESEEGLLKIYLSIVNSVEIKDVVFLTIHTLCFLHLW